MVVFIKGLNVVFFISFLFYYLSTSLPLFFSLFIVLLHSPLICVPAVLRDGGEDVLSLTED